MAAIFLFVLSLIQAEALRAWLDPGKTLKLVLPDDGLFGLNKGSRIEVLGTTAGKVLRIVIDPDQRIHAEARINESMAVFIRRDSRAVIRKTFGVAGESYVEITRGRGEPMDWEFAVLDTSPDRAPTDSIGETLEDIRSRVIPILDQTQRAMTAVADITERFADPDGDLQGMLGDMGRLVGRVEQGEGTLGRLMADETSARELENLLQGASAAVARLGPLLEELQATAIQVTQLSGSINAQSQDLPAISRDVQSILASLDGIMVDLRKTTPQLPGIVRNIDESTASVPVLLGTTQQTLTELEALLRQLRSSWLLGGAGGGAAEGGRLPPTEIRP